MRQVKGKLLSPDKPDYAQVPEIMVQQGSPATTLPPGQVGRKIVVVEIDICCDSGMGLLKTLNVRTVVASGYRDKLLILAQSADDIPTRTVFRTTKGCNQMDRFGKKFFM